MPSSSGSGSIRSSGSFGSGVAIPWVDRSGRRCPRCTDPVPPIPLSPLPPSPPTIPLERRRVGIPVGGRRLGPPNDLLGIGRVLPVQRPALQDPLDALGHVRPRPAQWGVH